MPESLPDPVPELPPPPGPTSRSATASTARAERGVQTLNRRPESYDERPAGQSAGTPYAADGRGTEAEKTVRVTLERAKAVLNTVNFNPLEQ